MTPRPLVVVGAGGFGREALDVVEAVNASLPVPQWQVVGVLDDHPSPENLRRLAAREIANLGPLKSWLSDAPSDVDVLIGVGTPAVRRRLVELIDRSATVTYPVLIHPRAHVGSQASLGPGTIVCGGAQVSTNVRTGAHVHINPNATIGHDTILGDFVSVNPAATVSGECVVDHETLIGAGSVILQQLRVGHHVTVGASACVVDGVPDMCTAKGVPARCAE